MRTLFQDLRYGFRMLWKSPGFTIVAMVVLALGIGANTAIFNVINTVLLRPLPFKEPGRLMTVWATNVRRGDSRGAVSYPDFVDWRTQNHVFEQMAVYTGENFTLTGGLEPAHLTGEVVSADLFSLLGVTPSLGRGFRPEEDAPVSGRTVVLSHRLWQERFNSDPNIVGQTIVLNNHNFTVIGVMPVGFQFPIQAEPVELWTTIAVDAVTTDSDPPMTEQRGNHFLNVIARLRPGTTTEQAQAEMNTIASRLENQYPDTNTWEGVRIVPEFERLVGDIRLALLVLFGAVGCVLLIACANVANLLLALWGIDLLIKLSPENIPRLAETSLDGRVFGFMVLVSLLTGIIFGLAPALQASKTDLAESLKEGGRASTEGIRRNRVRSALVVMEVALALVLLVGAGLLIQSFFRLQRVDPGFDPNHVLTFRIDLPEVRYATAQQIDFYQHLLDRIRAIPGVSSASAIFPLPLSDAAIGVSFEIEGRPIPKGQEPSTQYRAIGLDYFRTMGIPLLKGRDYTAHDDRRAPAVIIVNEEFVRRIFPNEDPIGKRIKPGLSTDETKPVMREIVGVVGDVKHRSLTRGPDPEVYVPDAQVSFDSMTVVARTETDTRVIIAAARNEVWTLDKDLPIYDVKTLDQYLAGTIAQPRFNTLLLAIFASVALILTAVGLYGVLAYAVAQRTHEIGIRMALGARTRDVLRLVIWQGMILAVIGVAIGLGASFAVTRLISSLLYGVSASDPATFAAISLLLTGVALLACYLPARRATKVDPMVALRYE